MLSRSIGSKSSGPSSTCKLEALVHGATFVLPAASCSPTHHKAACHPAPTSQSATGSHMVKKMADRDSYRHWLSVCRWVAHCYSYVILERRWLWVTYVPIYGCCESSINDLFSSDSSPSVAAGLNQRLVFHLRTLFKTTVKLLLTNCYRHHLTVTFVQHFF